ncbi:MAG: methyltransferase domain-containing protein, partial [Actinomycetota bacterium]|nr:methyltransferase domain-containing protein [Actinomycetota bacterium]
MAVPPGVPEWLPGILRCPEDEGTLMTCEHDLRCSRCDRTFPVVDGVVELLPAGLAHLGSGEGARSGERPVDQGVAWVSDEMEWWNPYYHGFHAPPFQRGRGLRGRSRERNLLRHVRERVGSPATVVEMGAGTSRTIAGLWPPASSGIRYAATDLSRLGLVAGRQLLGDSSAAVQCDAGAWPFAAGVADVVAILGVLHHVPDWRLALRQACRTLRPGGFLVLHEVVSKPRVLGRHRSAGVNDSWTSPHEGSISAEDLRRELEGRGPIHSWRGESTPLRFALLHYGRLEHRLDGSRALT